MFEINTILDNLNKDKSFIKVNANPTHILKYELEYKGGCPIIGVYDTTFNIITFPDYNENFKIDGIEYQLIHVYEITRVRWKQWTH